MLQQLPSGQGLSALQLPGLDCWRLLRSATNGETRSARGNPRAAKDPVTDDARVALGLRVFGCNVGVDSATVDEMEPTVEEGDKVCVPADLDELVDDDDATVLEVEVEDG